MRHRRSHFRSSHRVEGDNASLKRELVEKAIPGVEIAIGKLRLTRGGRQPLRPADRSDRDELEDV
jgi:hypothetical protein